MYQNRLGDRYAASTQQNLPESTQQNLPECLLTWNKLSQAAQSRTRYVQQSA